jgi:hypothetical protein
VEVQEDAGRTFHHAGQGAHLFENVGNVEEIFVSRVPIARALSPSPPASSRR